ncbi:MAG: hypothetical protein LBP40_00765 [Campylobacteraceae bacterium]|jgi:hypothetical protein|nr:hypothetical protein [Campylobacteraceae bacterium]
MTKETDYDKKLLVEGKNDQHIILALCKKFKIDEVFNVIDCEGIDNIYQSIPVFLKKSGIKTIGVIIDADNDIKCSYNRIKNRLSSEGIHIPSDLSEDGIIETQNKIKIGIWIMPNNNLNGTIEDFISFLVPKDDTLMPIAILTLDNIEQNRLNRYPLGHKNKAKIHTWLAWQKNPGIPIGASIGQGYLDAKHEVCKKLIAWLKKLFDAKH